MLVHAITTTVFIDFHIFRLVGEDGFDDVVPGGKERPPVYGVLPRGVLLHSAVNAHEPTVHLQIWDAPPEQDPSEWDAVADGEFSTRGNTLILACTTGAPNDSAVDLPWCGAVRFRAHYRNPLGLDETSVTRETQHTEEHLIQLWPGGARAEDRVAPPVAGHPDPV
ncbi:hypothetical protein FHR81_001189 [Actinoalloteichus hoggarensis]|uniref:Uncharacterized protein n=1 Tax=Actinoalloteichus hoggarensis TaxID=1470176 RepID=A0A221VZI9_9PSEU|nr:hypothetical protein [Actinoalloteichus hoggarensis]ASO18924.1 hypothetical protein AHOG_06360 [Actinoalloteichus hoggarensis]MBB5920159.1 hypothetical protein [Actinoalloteichus hoggarensis]